MPVLAPGHVWLAGAGPGDPGLLTLDALAGLQQADVIVYDALVDRARAGARRPAGAARIRRQARRQALGDAGRHQPSGWSSWRAQAGACCGSRAAIRSCSAAAARRRSRSPPPAFRSASFPASPPGSRRSRRRRSRRRCAASTARSSSPPATAPTRISTGRRSRAPAQPIVLYMVMHNLERIAEALMRAGLAGSDAGRRHRLGDDAAGAHPHLDAGQARRRRPRTKTRAAGDRGDRRHRERRASSCSAARRAAATE